jgi:starvation-inducible DNA-binding protein
MTELTESLKVLVADLVVFKFKAHGYHWNVEGKDFSEYHALFGTIYEDAEGGIDILAENIRKLGDYAPYKISRVLQLSTLPESDVTSNAQNMTSDLLQSNDMLIAKLKQAFNVANGENEQGVANFIAERIDMHQKWSWQLRASLHA